MSAPAPWGFHTLGRFTARVVPPGEPVWDNLLLEFSEPTWRAATIELYRPGDSTPFGALAHTLGVDQLRDAGERAGFQLAFSRDPWAPTPAEWRAVLTLAARCP